MPNEDNDLRKKISLIDPQQEKYPFWIYLKISSGSIVLVPVIYYRVLGPHKRFGIQDLPLRNPAYHQQSHPRDSNSRPAI
jgi:hypothetical protein